MRSVCIPIYIDPVTYADKMLELSNARRHTDLVTFTLPLNVKNDINIIIYIIVKSNNYKEMGINFGDIKINLLPNSIVSLDDSLPIMYDHGDIKMFVIYKPILMRCEQAKHHIGTFLEKNNDILHHNLTIDSFYPSYIDNNNMVEFLPYEMVSMPLISLEGKLIDYLIPSFIPNDYFWYKGKRYDIRNGFIESYKGIN